ncbi:MAG: ABC transporter ATP-binding protein [Micrococcales bacterium]|nr:ABC transporter ATP-binding protein [Micrococcales bacterium]
MAEAAAIRIRGLRVVRKKVLVIPGLDVDVAAGAITGLLGPSGCGKSTLMRAIVGVQIVESGSVEVLGLPAGSADLRHRVGYMTQEPSVYSDLTVRENLAHFARIYGVDQGNVDRAIDRVDLGSKADTVVSDLSGGQHSRVSLAASLVGEPDLLVLDEPTVGLDPVLRRDLWALFRSLASSGTTLLVSSHVMEEAVHCDRLLLMRDGHMLADGVRDDLLAATGAADIEAAFLALVEQEDGR